MKISLRLDFFNPNHLKSFIRVTAIEAAGIFSIFEFELFLEAIKDSSLNRFAIKADSNKASYDVLLAYSTLKIFEKVSSLQLGIFILKEPLIISFKEIQTPLLVGISDQVDCLKT